MSLSRSKIARKKEVDPFASDDEDNVKPEVKVARRVKPAVKKSVQMPPPKLKQDGSTIVDEKERYNLSMDEGQENVERTLLKVGGGQLTFPLQNPDEATVWVKADQRYAGKVTWGSEQESSIPVLRYAELDGQDFEVLRERIELDQMLLSADRKTRSMVMIPVSPWRYSIMPHFEDASHLISADEVFRQMKLRRWGKDSKLDELVKDVTLSPAEKKNFRQVAAASNLATINKFSFNEVWAEIKEKKPPPELVRRLFGSGNAEFGVEEIVLKVEGLANADRERGLEEVEQREQRARAREEANEQDYEEEVEGNERQFDDDVEDNPEQDPDQGHMDRETKMWGAAAKDDSLDDQTWRQLNPLEASEPTAAADALAEETRKAEFTKRFKDSEATGDPEEYNDDDEDDDDDDEEPANDSTSYVASPAPDKSPAPSSANTPPPPVKQVAKKAGGKKGAKRAADTPSPSPPPSSKKQKQDPLRSEIDVALRKLFNKGPRGGRKGPAVYKSMKEVHQSVIGSLSAFEEHKKAAKARVEAGSAASIQECLLPVLEELKAVVTERVSALGGGKDEASGKITM